MSARDAGLAFTDGAAQFESWSAALWRPAAEAMVRKAALRPGETVLDACCGSGAVTIPAAQAVGPDGQVDGVDLSIGLLAFAGKALAASGILNTTLTYADITTWRGHRQYDAVLCSYSIFFLENMVRGTEHILLPLRSGGRFLVNTWNRDALSPLAETIRDAAVTERPRLAGVEPVPNHNMAQIDTEKSFSAWLSARGLSKVEVETIPITLTVSAEEAWTLVMGSGWRTLLPRVPEAMFRVRQEFLDRIGPKTVSFDCTTLLASGIKN